MGRAGLRRVDSVAAGAGVRVGGARAEVEAGSATARGPHEGLPDMAGMPVPAAPGFLWTRMGTRKARAKAKEGPPAIVDASPAADLGTSVGTVHLPETRDRAARRRGDDSDCEPGGDDDALCTFNARKSIMSH